MASFVPIDTAIDALVKCKSAMCGKCPVKAECREWKGDLIEVPEELLEMAIGKLQEKVDAVPVIYARWVRVAGGFYTPGGDPVWRCSKCGKGQHVYGVEHSSYGANTADGQWVACPNCGAKMDEEEPSKEQREEWQWE